MVFNSLQYAVFLPLFVAMYWNVGPRFRPLLLLAGSYGFYGAWDVRFLGLLIFSTFTDFFVAQAIQRSSEATRRKRLLLLSVVVNLGILATFKYLGFFVDSAAGLISKTGLDPNLALLRLTLPVGISFYTFQSMSYSFDVYRGRIEASNQPIRFATYVAFFPQLVAGPIERAVNLLPQLERDQVPPNGDRVFSALILIVVGLFKKVVIADQLSPSRRPRLQRPGQLVPSPGRPWA